LKTLPLKWRQACFDIQPKTPDPSLSELKSAVSEIAAGMKAPPDRGKVAT
jgi:hypothetical protein